MDTNTKISMSNFNAIASAVVTGAIGTATKQNRLKVEATELFINRYN